MVIGDDGGDADDDNVYILKTPPPPSSVILIFILLHPDPPHICHAYPPPLCIYKYKPSLFTFIPVVFLLLFTSFPL